MRGAENLSKCHEVGAVCTPAAGERREPQIFEKHGK